MIPSICVSILLLAAPPAAKPEWEDPAVFAVGTEQPARDVRPARDARGSALRATARARRSSGC